MTVLRLIRNSKSVWFGTTTGCRSVFKTPDWKWSESLTFIARQRKPRSNLSTLREFRSDRHPDDKKNQRCCPGVFGVFSFSEYSKLASEGVQCRHTYMGHQKFLQKGQIQMFQRERFNLLLSNEVCGICTIWIKCRNFTQHLWKCYQEK